MIAERVRSSITRLPQGAKQSKKRSGKGKSAKSRKPIQPAHDLLVKRLKASIRLLEPNVTVTGREYFRYSYYSSLYSPGEGCPTLTAVLALEIKLKTGEIVYVTVNGQLVDKTMGGQYMAPMTPHDFVFRYEGLHGKLSEDDEFLNGLIKAIKKAAKAHPPKQ